MHSAIRITAKGVTNIYILQEKQMPCYNFISYVKNENNHDSCQPKPLVKHPEVKRGWFR